MSVHIPPSVEEEPEILLSRWRIMELPNGDRHLIGHNVRWNEGRVSSKIKKQEGRHVFTRSGRKYLLVGESAADADADYLWQRWQTINGIDPTDIKVISKVESE